MRRRTTVLVQLSYSTELKSSESSKSVRTLSRPSRYATDGREAEVFGMEGDRIISSKRRSILHRAKSEAFGACINKVGGTTQIESYLFLLCPCSKRYQICNNAIIEKCPTSEIKTLLPLTLIENLVCARQGRIRTWVDTRQMDDIWRRRLK